MPTYSWSKCCDKKDERKLVKKNWSKHLDNIKYLTSNIKVSNKLCL